MMLPSAVAFCFCLGALKGVHSLDDVLYGEPIYIESGTERATLWLSGARSTGNTGLRTLNALADNQLQVREAYRWKILSEPGTGSISDATQDKRQGECVKFGDVVYLQNLFQDNKWVSGSRSTGNRDVFTLEIENEDSPSFKWVVRSSLGNGSLDEATDDLGYGQCIFDVSAVFFQNLNLESRWLTGNRGGDGSVNTLNIFESDERDALASYQWILSNELASPGGAVAPIRCAAWSSTGRWVKGPYTNGGVAVTYFEGVDRESSTSFTQTQSWEATVTATVSAGFNVGIGSGEASLSVSASYGGSMEKSVSNTVSIQTAREETFDFDDGAAGQVWQWQYDVRDICNANPWSLKTNSLVITPSEVERPCCLPGFAADVDVQHGACLGDSPCICFDSECQAINEPSTSGWEAQSNVGLYLVWFFVTVQVALTCY